MKKGNIYLYLYQFLILFQILRVWRLEIIYQKHLSYYEINAIIFCIIWPFLRLKWSFGCIGPTDACRNFSVIDFGFVVFHIKSFIKSSLINIPVVSVYLAKCLCNSLCIGSSFDSVVVSFSLFTWIGLLILTTYFDLSIWYDYICEYYISLCIC